MVGKRVVSSRHTGESPVFFAEVGEGKTDDPGRIRLESQGHQVVKERRPVLQGQGIHSIRNGIAGVRLFLVQPEG